MRSFTSSVLPARGPTRAPASGSGSHVITAFAAGPPGPTASGSSLTACGSRDQRDGLDLDAGARDDEGGDLDERRGRPRVAEHLLAHGVDHRPVGDVGEVHGDLDHVGERASSRGEDVPHVGEHLARLRDDVVPADELAPLVDGDDPAHEQQIAGDHRVGEVGDGLGRAPAKPAPSVASRRRDEDDAPGRFSSRRRKRPRASKP